MQENTRVEVDEMYATACDAAGVSPDIPIRDLSPEHRSRVYVHLRRMQKTREVESTRIGQIAGEMEPDIIEHFRDNGVQNMKVDGFTLYLRRDVYPKIDDSDLLAELGENPSPADVDAARARARDRLIEALKQNESTSFLVSESYNLQSLRGFLNKDCEEGDDGLPIPPPHLVGKVTVSEVFRASVRS